MYATARQAVFMLMYNDCYQRFCMLAEEGRVVQEQARRTLLNYRERAKSGSRATRPRAHSLPSPSRLLLPVQEDRVDFDGVASPRIDMKLRKPIGLSDDHLAAAAAAAESVALTNRSEKKKGGSVLGRRKSVAVARPKSAIVSALSRDIQLSDSGPSSAPSTSRVPASVAFTMSPRRSKSTTSLSSSSSEVPTCPVHSYVDPFAAPPTKFSSTPTHSAPKLHLVQRGSSTPAKLPSPSTRPLGSPSSRRSKKRKSKSRKETSSSPSSSRKKLHHRRNNSTNSIPSTPNHSPPPSSVTTTLSSSTPPPSRGLQRGSSTPLPRSSQAIEVGKTKGPGRRHRRRKESGGRSNRSSKSSEHRKVARKKRKAQSSSTPDSTVATPLLRSSTDSDSEAIRGFPHSSLSSREPSDHSSSRPRSASISSSAHSSPPRESRSRTKSDAPQREKREVSVGEGGGMYSTSDAV
eukprot:TRINITY_DN930_c0_g1_i2.p1 TRINITY_DN930_c0_g1~~TRINITY_DN930_c0_g1_i2.p1  ORF type:complete len:462 (-),score=115.83 TRINITY_DN930_c0_g1_i2:14-1399(-)